MAQTNLDPAKPSISIIGAGKVGLTIATIAIGAGLQISAIAGRDQSRTREISRDLPVEVCSMADAAKKSQIVFLTVPDDAIQSVCQELANGWAFSKNQIVVHCSGALTSEKLATARDICGAKIASVHPLQTFPTIQSGVDSMPGTYWFCEGDETALLTLMPIITQMGGIPEKIATQNKALYHCASVMACNYLVGLMDAALSVAQTAGLDSKTAWTALTPIIQATLTNIGAQGTAGALTGPIARGDLVTVQRHLEALNEVSEQNNAQASANTKISSKNQELVDIYKTMGRWTTQLARQKGLSQERGDALLGLLK